MTIRLARYVSLNITILDLSRHPPHKYFSKTYFIQTIIAERQWSIENFNPGRRVKKLFVFTISL